MTDNLRQKTINGISWSFIDNFSNQGVAFVVGIIIANFVTPTEYGLLGVVMIFIALFNNIVDSGFSNALIRKKETSEVDYNTIFIVNFITSVALYFLLFILSPYIADFFHQSKLNLLLKVTGVIVIINAVTIIQKTILVRAIDFKTQTKASLVSSIISGIIGIVAAIVGMGVWSLVIQQLLRQILYTIVIWSYAKWWPRLQFSIESLKDLFGFGWKLLAVGMIDTIWKEIYQVVIGKYYSMSTLGQYTRAKQFSDGFTYGLLTVIQRVSLPTLSPLQDDDQRLREVLREIIKTSMFVLSPCLIGLMACSDALLHVLIGDQWNDAAYYLKILCTGLLISPIIILDQNVLQVKKKSGTVLLLNIITKAFAVFPIAIGIIYSIDAMLIISSLLGYTVIAPVTIAQSTGKYLNYGVLDHIKDLFKIIVVSLLMGAAMYVVPSEGISDYLILIMQLVVGISSFIVLCVICKISEYYTIKSIIYSYGKKLKHILTN